MAEDDTIEEGVLEQLVQKLWPCIGRGELDACVEEAARLAGEVGIGAAELLDLAVQMGNAGKHEFAYVLALGAVNGLDSSGKAIAYSNAGGAAQYLGNVDKAEAHYLKAIEIDPKLATVHYVYANLLEEQDRNEEADEHYKKAIEGDSKLAAAYNAKEFLHKLEPCIERGELDACVEEATRLANKVGIDALVLLSLSAQMGNAEKHDFAYVLALGAVGELDGSEKAGAYSNAGLAAQSLGNVDKAEIHYLKGIEVDSNYAAVHSNYANLLKELNRKDEAEAHYLKAIEANPNDAVAHHNYAILLDELNRTDEAAAHYIKCIEADPNYAAAHNDYANLLVELNRKWDAETHYLKAIECDPNYATAHNNYALLLNELNRKDVAEIHYLKAIECDSNYAAAYSNYAILLNELSRTDEAEAHYLKAIETNPKFAAAHNNYANLLGELSRTDEAEAYYLKAIEADPNYATAHNNYALLLVELNRKDTAKIHYAKAIKADPNYATAHNNYANLLKESNRKDEAEAHYLKAIDADPDNADAHYHYANLLKESNKNDEAEAHYLKVINLDPDDAAAHNNYAIILRERGKFYEAENEVRRALQIAQDDYSLQDILPYAHGTLGDILADEDCYEDAEREYQKALDKSDSMDNSSISEIHNNLGWVYTQMRIYKKARDEFKKARVLDSMNVKAIRNSRALGRMGAEPIVSKIQVYLGIMLLIPLIILYYLFIMDMLSETLFVAQSTIFIALLIFVALHHQLAKVKIGSIEFEKSTEHRSLESKSQPQDAISKVER